MKPSPSIETGVIAAPLTVVESMVLLHTEVNRSIGKRPYLVNPVKSNGWAGQICHLPERRYELPYRVNRPEDLLVPVLRFCDRIGLALHVRSDCIRRLADAHNRLCNLGSCISHGF